MAQLIVEPSFFVFKNGSEKIRIEAQLPFCPGKFYIEYKPDWLHDRKTSLRRKSNIMNRKGDR